MHQSTTTYENEGLKTYYITRKSLFGITYSVTKLEMAR